MENRWNEVSEELKQDIIQFLSDYHEKTLQIYKDNIEHRLQRDSTFWDTYPKIDERLTKEQNFCDFLKSIGLSVTYDITGFFNKGYIADAPYQEDFIDEWCRKMGENNDS